MQILLVGILTSLIALSPSLAAQPGDAESQTASAATKSVHEWYVEDQEDTRTIKDAASEGEYQKRVKVREIALNNLLASGEVKTGDEFMEAAFIFQHGGAGEDSLFAHVLAVEAVAKGALAAKFIAAATLDRYLQSIKQPQIFGTNYVLDPTHPIQIPGSPFPSGRTLEPYNENLLPDSMRTDFCVPTKAQQQQNIALFNAGKWPRETMHPPCP